MAIAGQKDPGALLTIGELSHELGVPQHILRYWETRFPQLRPMQRAGNRRYYRPADVELARKISRLLTQEGYTVRGVQKLLRERTPEDPTASDLSAKLGEEPASPAAETSGGKSVNLLRLMSLRDRLVAALEH